MKRNFLLLTLILCPALAPANTTKLRVKKVKGQMALVEIQGKVNAGENYFLVPADNSPEDLKTGPRKHRLGGTFTFISSKTKTSSVEFNPSELSFTVDYGWNHGSYEIGPLLGYSSVSTGFGGATTSITAGFFYDYNFSENVEPTSYLFGAGLKTTYTNVAPPSGVTGLYAVAFYPNFFWKWWAFGHSTALKLDMGYGIEQGKDSSGSSYTTSGVKSSGSLLFYY